MKFVILSVGFLIASLFQGFIVFISKSTGFSQFDIQFTFARVIHHVLVGQLSGYVLFWLISYMNQYRKAITLIVGSLFGVLSWAIVMLVGIHTGLIRLSWLNDSGVSTTLFAFIIYGLISGFTIWNWRQHYGRVERNRHN